MNKKVLFAISLPLILLFESCSQEVEYTVIPEPNQLVSAIGGEEKAIETFNNVSVVGSIIKLSIYLYFVQK
jgi:hypothetical protein